MAQEVELIEKVSGLLSGPLQTVFGHGPCDLMSPGVWVCEQLHLNTQRGFKHGSAVLLLGCNLVSYLAASTVSILICLGLGQCLKNLIRLIFEYKTANPR